MKTQDAVAILRAHNVWRRYDGPLGGGPEMGDAKKIGIAIDTVCDALEATNQRARELTWQDVKRIVELADKALDSDCIDTEEHYYTEVLRRFNDGRNS